MCSWIAFPYFLCTVTTTQTKLTITLTLLWILQVCFTGKYIGAIYFKPFWSFYMETKFFQNVCFSARRNFCSSEQFLHGVLSWDGSPWLTLISSYHWILFTFEDLTFVRSRAVLRSVSKKRIPGAVTVILLLTWTPYSGLFPIPQFTTELPVSRQCVSKVSQSQITCLELSLCSGTDTTQHNSTDFHLTCLFLKWEQSKILKTLP